MKTKRSHEGYLLIDNRCGPGVTQDFIRQSGKSDVPFAPEGAMVEAPTLTCSHCHTQMIVNPDRTRARGYCGKCDHYVCDPCEAARVATGICRPMTQVIDELQNAAVKNLGREQPSLILTDLN